MRICTECCARAWVKVSTHMAGTAHKAGAAGPDDEAAEDDEAEPEGSTAGEEDEELDDPEGAPGMSAARPASKRARGVDVSLHAGFPLRRKLELEARAKRPPFGVIDVWRPPGVTLANTAGGVQQIAPTILELTVAKAILDDLRAAHHTPMIRRV
jgi:hypothetical protein